jgi:hypothetical protein
VPIIDKMNRMRRLTRFSLFIYLVGFLAISWLLVWPLIMNAWAGWIWQRVPCVSKWEERHAFIYRLGDKTYISGHRDFWQLDFTTAILSEDESAFAPDSTCFVNPSNPIDAVLYLDAHTNFSNSLGRFVAAALVTGAVIFVARTNSTKTKSLASSNAQAAVPADEHGKTTS